MPGTARLLYFGCRALVALLLLAVLWPSVAGPYNTALVTVARPLLPSGASLRAVGTHFLIEAPPGSLPVSFDGLALHYGLVLLAVLVLAWVGIGPLQRLAWLAGLGAGAFLAHLLGVALLARIVAWSTSGAIGPDASRLMLGLFAVFWGLVPALAGGAWCLLRWLPRASDGPAPA